MTKAEKLIALRTRFRSELPARLDAIELAWQKDKLTTQNEEFYRLVHSLAGSAGTFGYAKLGEQAHVLELLLQELKVGATEHEQAEPIEQFVTNLRDIMLLGGDQGDKEEIFFHEESPVATKKQHLIYLLEDDINFAEELLNQLEYFDYRVEIFDNVQALHDGIASQQPDVLLADIHLPEGAEAGSQAVSELRKGATSPIPVIFISALNSWQNRLNAVRAGSQAFLSKPVNINALLEQLDEILGESLQASDFRILIVDDSELLAEHYANVLEAAGMQTQIINEPSKLLDVLPEFRPDLILMDLYMPNCSGVEAAQVLRQHMTYIQLPIVFLSTEKALEKQLDALYVGGDDFLQKPISNTHLVKAVKCRAQRFRELTALMTRDGLTGLLNHINLKLTLEREVSQALRRSSSLSFVMIDIDNFKSVNDGYGHPTGDKVIKSLARLLCQRLRKGDIAARYGGEEFALILPDTEGQVAYDLIDALRKQFGQLKYTYNNNEFNVTFSAGIATCPAHADMNELIAAADTALYQAKQAGRSQVVVDKDSLKK